MRKFVCGILALTSVLCMGACGGDKENNRADKDGGLKLSYGVKYIDEYVASGEGSGEAYFIFNKDGTAEYHAYSTYGANVYSYTTKWKYKIVEEENMVFCFYDGIEYDTVDTAKNVEKDRVRSYMYTEDFLMSTGGRMYLAEDFLKEELPNFDK